MDSTLNPTKVVASVVAFAAVLGILFAAPTSAQVVGATLSGVITDESGAAVPGAKLSIKNVATGNVREATCNGDGLYSAPNLLPGAYDVTVSAQGFATSVQKGTTLTVGTQQALNFRLKIGQVTETVEVKDVPPTVQTNSSTLSATVDSTTMRELPLNGRDWTSLATLEPGVVSIPTQAGTAFNANKGNRGFGNQLSNGGHRPYENTYRINGVTINDYSNGSPGGASGTNLGVDGIQEFSVLTTDYTAEYGRTSGAVINAITKSGTNQIHGTGFFFDRDKIFDARNFFDPVGPIPSFRRIQFGASAGGAIVKDKTFLYGAYEGIRQNQPISTPITVPSAAERSLAVSAVVPYLALWPNAPGVTPLNSDGVTQTFNTSLPTIANENYFTGRVDQKMSGNDTLAGSYFWDSGPLKQPDSLGNAIHSVFSRRQMASAEETHIFSPQVVNTFQVGVSRVRGDINLPVSGDQAATSSALAIAPGATATPTIRGTTLTSGVGLGGLNQFLHKWNSLQVHDDAFVTRGTHATKVGFAFERMQYNVTEKLSPNGAINYGGSLSDFLNNVPHNLRQIAPVGDPNFPTGGSHEVGLRESLFGVYVQDDWRALRNVTVNLGLRYEMTTRPTEAHNLFQEITGPFTSACQDGTNACGPHPVNSPIATNPTLRNFEPRIGFAWDPFSDGKTAVRGAFGIFDVLPLPYVFGLNDAAVFPFQIVGSGPAQLGTPATVSFNPNKIRERFMDDHPKRADVLNWNLNIQRELGPGWTVLVGYVGSRSVHLPTAADDVNLVQPLVTSSGLLWPCDISTTPCTVGNGTRIDSNWGGGAGFRPTLFDGAASYSALQSQLKKSMSHDVQGQVSYTFGKCRDLGSAPHTGDPYLNTIAVPILLNKMYRTGGCDFDIRQNLVGTIIWDVPGPKSSSGIAYYLAGGWELGSIVTASTGSPFTATLGADGDPLGTNFNGDFSMDFANLVPGCKPIHGGVNYLNLNCFALPQATPAIALQCAPFVGNGTAQDPQFPGTCSNLLGNAGRNTLYGPRRTTVDFSIFKNTHFPGISETFNVQFRAEFFNLLNHTNFGAPGFLNSQGQNNSIFNADGSPQTGAGALNTTSSTSRQIQLGLKVIW